MYKKVDAERNTAAFWKTLGQYLSVVPAAAGTKANWLNYDTEIKGIDFRISVQNEQAEVAIVFDHPDPAQNVLRFSKMKALKQNFEAVVGQWRWDEAQLRIYKALQEVETFRKEDWPKIIPFVKENMVALDLFWSESYYFFQDI